LCIEAENINNNQLTNEKDEFYDRSKSQRNRKKEKGKGKENLVRCDGAGLCEAGKNRFFLFLAEARKKWGKWVIYLLVVTIDLIDIGQLLPLFFPFELSLLSCLVLVS
jgi:hypothetical protein